jgi:type IV fimbrial biogenesis protein FimT
MRPDHLPPCSRLCARALVSRPRLRERPARRVWQGFTLINALLCVAVLAIVGLIALPSFQASIQQHRLQVLASDFSHDLQLARSLAIGGQQSLRLSVLGSPGGSCYILHGAGDDRCRCSPTAAQCDGDAHPLRFRWIASSSHTRIAANVPGITLHAGEGFVTSAGTFRVEEPRSGRGIWYVVSPAGRVRSCAQGWALRPLPPCSGAAA